MPVITKVEVDPSGTPFIIGQDMASYFMEIFEYLTVTGDFIDLVGPPGSGKSHMATELGKQYARETGCEFLTTQADEETTRSTFWGGLRFTADGGEDTFLAVCGYAYEYGHIVHVDELTHSLPSVHGGFNRAADARGMLSVGDRIIKRHPRARFIFSHNETKSAGNYGLKPSTASRLVAFPFDYPAPKTEALIARQLAYDALGKENVDVPDGVIRFLVQWMRELREFTNNQLPISARNIAGMIKMMSLAQKYPVGNQPLDWDAAGSSESIRGKVARWVAFLNTNDQLEDDGDIHSPLVDQVMRYFLSFAPEPNKSREKASDIVLRHSMHYLDIEGIAGELMRRYREQMRSTLL